MSAPVTRVRRKTTAPCPITSGRAVASVVGSSLSPEKIPGIIRNNPFRVSPRLRRFPTGARSFSASAAANAAARLFSLDIGAAFLKGITIDELKALLETRVGDWSSEGEPPAVRPTPPPAESRSRPNVVIVDKKGATQTYVRIVSPGISRNDPDYTALRLANVVFGGSFSSRLTQNLRETHGFTYGVGSDITRYRGPGAFVAASSVQKDVTGESIGEFFNEYRKIAAGGINEMELRKARSTLTQSVVRSLETLSGTVGLFASLARSGLPPTDAGRLLEEVDRASQADLDTAGAPKKLTETRRH